MSQTARAARPPAAPAMPVDLLSRLAPNQRAPRSAVPVLILGLDDKGRPHASRFSGPEAALAKEAAAAMQMCALPVEAEPLQRLADRLPKGKLFASGKAFVPFVKQALYDQLVGHLPEGVTPPTRTPKPVQANANLPAGGGGEPAGAAAKPGAPTASVASSAFPEDWSEIKKGNLVLASIERDDGWWPAIITGDKGDGLYEVQWQDWLDWEPFLRKREQLALFHPGYNGQ